MGKLEDKRPAVVLSLCPASVTDLGMSRTCAVHCRLAAFAAVALAVVPAQAAEGAAPAVIFLYSQDQAEQARAVSTVVASQL
jgi:hypothetical protein